MANQLRHLLRQWHPHRDETEWVLGTVYKTERSSYRKAGAMMLFNGWGQQFGLLSGGCLESGIQRHASRVMQRGRSQLVCYDSTDEADLSFQLGIGCGGVVHILLQPVSRENNYLSLSALLESLERRESGSFQQLVAEDGETAAHFSITDQQAQSIDISDHKKQSLLVETSQSGRAETWLVTRVEPEPHLLIVGGGPDAIPVVNMAEQLGWETTVWDPRPANARPEYFASATRILKCTAEGLGRFAQEHRVNAAVLMSHNVQLDAEALKILQTSDNDIQYMGLLGPSSRREKVISEAGLNNNGLSVPLSGPAGLDIGGELPESIALSILSECHARLLKNQAWSLNAVSVA